MKRFLALIGLPLLVLGVVSASTYAGYGWRSANHLTIYETTTQPQWTAALDVAVVGWNASDNVEFEVRRVAECPRKFKVCVDEFSAPDQVGYAYARIFVRNGIIQQATVVLNDYYVDFTKDPAIFQRTMCHELGHVLGLSPDADPDSCMSAGVPHPSERDYAQLAAIYGR